MSHIIRLEAENVCRLRAIELMLDNGVVKISGRNGQGKTSVLNCVRMILGGARQTPDEPLRRGARKGFAEIELSDGLVARQTVTPSGGTLTVTTKDGSPVKSPRELFKSMVGAISFDPLAWAAKKEDEQVAELRKLVGLDFSKQDAAHNALKERRTEIGREVKRLDGAIASLPVPVAGIPDAEVSISELAAELERRRSINAEHRDASHKLEGLRARSTALQQEIAKVEQTLEELRATLLATVEEGRAQRDKTYAMPLADEQEVLDKMAGADAINAKVRAMVQRVKLEAERERRAAEVDEHTEKMLTIEEEKRAALAAAKMPIDGLEITDAGVRYHGVPLKQASSAERTRVSTAIAIATNPQIKVILIEDGSLLDDESMAAVAELAAEHDAQVLVEVVGKGAGSIVIEDGMVAGAAANQDAAREPGSEG